MPPTAEQALLDLIEDIFSNACISFASRDTGPVEYRTTTLMLQSARTASLAQRAELALQLLLSQPPFVHTSSSLLPMQQERFFGIWSRDHITSSANNGEILTPNRCLSFLTSLRVDFQRLQETGFLFVSDLLLSCLERLTPESSSRNQGSKVGWVATHADAVEVLEELLFSVPPAEWLRLDTHSEYTAPVWKCLQLLCSGASWWSSSAEGEVYRRSLERLGRCVFSLPNARSLLRAALRVDMKPVDIHSTMTTLLAPLERLLGVHHDTRIIAFTPTPFSFPALPALDRHDFEKAYEYDNLRVMFVAWINADSRHRKREEFKNPWRMENVLQHSEAWKKLKMHPESCVRVALVYIFNEIQQGCEGFKPSTDAKAIELLKTYIAYRRMQITRKTLSGVSRSNSKQDVRDRPEACVVQNSRWVLPWLWKRRGVDTEFAMIVTSAWLVSWSVDTTLATGHPICQLTRAHSEGAFEIFHGFFKTIFSYDYVAKSVDKENALEQIRTLLRTVLAVFKILGKEDISLLNSQLCLLLIRTFTESLDQEWITPECWYMACEVFTLVPKESLTEAVEVAQVTSGIELLVHIFLREIEAITALCSNSSPATLAISILSSQLSTLTHMLQFTAFLAKACDLFCSALSKKSHFINSALLYASKGWRDLLLRSEKPGLYWAHSASVSATMEVLIVIGFGNNRLPAISMMDVSTFGNVGKRGDNNPVRMEAAGGLVLKILSRTWEMDHVIPVLCGLVGLITPEWWHKRPFVYLDIWSRLRTIVFERDMHKFCTLLPSFGRALSVLLAVPFPTAKLLLHSRWNLGLSSSLISRLLETSSISPPGLRCPTCGQSVGVAVCKLLTALASQEPVWKLDLLKSAGMGGHSVLDFETLEKLFEKLMEDGQLEEAAALAKLGVCWEGWQGKAKIWTKRCERERRAAAGVGCVKEANEAWYAAYRPISGAVAVFVPT